jgi:uncharacterized protein YjlB
VEEWNDERSPRSASSWTTSIFPFHHYSISFFHYGRHWTRTRCLSAPTR